MSAFIETIQVIDGEFCNFSFHVARMKETSVVFLRREIVFIPDELIVPEDLREGVVKCRIIYDYVIREVEFIPYHIRKIASLKLVEDNEIVYPFKSTDRDALKRLSDRRGDRDEVLIVKQGQITDTSFSNVVFRACDGLYTPSAFLLNGTRRQRLLREGIVREREIRVADLTRYQGVFLINAMIDLSDQVYVPVERIYSS